MSHYMRGIQKSFRKRGSTIFVEMKENLNRIEKFLNFSCDWKVGIGNFTDLANLLICLSYCKKASNLNYKNVKSFSNVKL